MPLPPGISREELQDVKAFKSKGCDECRGTGFHGHTLLFECMVLDEALRNLLAADTPVQNIYDRAIELGMKSIRKVFLEGVSRGDLRLFDYKATIL